MPAFDVAERHGIVVRAPAERAYAAIRSVDLSRSLLIRSLFALRGLPAMFAGRREARRRLTLDDFFRSWFVVLAEEPRVEIVLGLIGRFWRREVASFAWRRRSSPPSGGRGTPRRRETSGST